MIIWNMISLFYHVVFECACSNLSACVLAIKHSRLANSDAFAVILFRISLSEWSYLVDLVDHFFRFIAESTPCPSLTRMTSASLL